MTAKAKTAASAEEPMKPAGQESVTLTAEKAKSHFRFLPSGGGMSGGIPEAAAGKSVGRGDFQWPFSDPLRIKR